MHPRRVLEDLVHQVDKAWKQCTGAGRFQTLKNPSSLAFVKTVQMVFNRRDSVISL